MRLLSSQPPPTVSPLLDVLMNALGAILALLIVYVWIFDDQRRHVERILVAYQDAQEALYLALEAEFRDDLPAWNAELDRDTLTIRFRDSRTAVADPGIQFKQGSAELLPRFSQILDDFFPRYIAVLRDPRYAATIEEIRIEGHTSSEWTTQVSAEEAYFLNMRLSQDRTRTVLRYGLGILDDEQQTWARGLVTANGLSSSKPILVDGVEDVQRSRRVEFRTRTAAEREIVRILQEGSLTRPRSGGPAR